MGNKTKGKIQSVTTIPVSEVPDENEELFSKEANGITALEIVIEANGIRSIYTPWPNAKDVEDGGPMHDLLEKYQVQLSELQELKGAVVHIEEKDGVYTLSEEQDK